MKYREVLSAQAKQLRTHTLFYWILSVFCFMLTTSLQSQNIVVVLLMATFMWLYFASILRSLCWAFVARSANGALGFSSQTFAGDLLDFVRDVA